jgi:hypothetical protein
MANTFSVDPVEDGFKVRDSGGRSILGDRLFPTVGDAVDALRTLLKGHGLGMHVTSGEGNSLLATTFPASSLAAEVRLSLPPPAADALNRILAKTGDKPGEVFGKALGLYLLALDARDRGKVVGAADSADVLETEFTGF